MDTPPNEPPMNAPATLGTAEDDPSSSAVADRTSLPSSVVPAAPVRPEVLTDIYWAWLSSDQQAYVAQDGAAGYLVVLSNAASTTYASHAHYEERRLHNLQAQSLQRVPAIETELGAEQGQANILHHQWERVRAVLVDARRAHPRGSCDGCRTSAHHSALDEFFDDPGRYRHRSSNLPNRRDAGRRSHHTAKHDSALELSADSGCHHHRSSN